MASVECAQNPEMESSYLYMPVSNEFDRIVGSIMINGTDEIPCTIVARKLQIEFHLAFAPGKSAPTKYIVNPVGIIEMKIIPYPTILDILGKEKQESIEGPDMPCIFIISFLENIFDHSTVKTFLFTGLRGPITALKDRLEAASSKIKRSLSFEAPDLNISYADTEKGSPNAKGSHKHYKASSFFELIGGESQILEIPEIELLRLAFPTRFQPCSWKMIYDAQTNGMGLSQLYYASQNKKPLVLLISDDSRERFGAFLPEGINETDDFYGTGETFVFSFNPLISIFKWTRANSFFICSSSKDLTIGSSNTPTGAAIYLDEMLRNGFSNACQTYGSAPLVQKSPFRVINVELWHVAQHTSEITSPEI